MTKILLEDIWDLKKYFPKIPNEDYVKLISLDPTYKGGDIAGTYAKWILSLANKGKLNNIGHVTDILNRFEDNKKNLKNKDIMSFKTIEDLDNYLNDENSYKQLTQRQELRQTQKAVRTTSIEDDAELVYSDSEWDVYVPKTYEASCKLGHDTTWCTASTSSDYYYDHYTSQGNLYININKKTGEKYQFHFESGSFMDADDRSINIKEFFDNNKNLYNFYEPIIFKKLGFDSNYEAVVKISFDTLSKELSDRNFDRDFLYGLMTGDIWEFWESYNESYSISDIEYNISDLDTSNKEILRKHNISIDNIAEELKNNHDLYNAFNVALNEGNDIGSQNLAITDFEDAIKDAIEFESEINSNNDGYIIYLNKDNGLELLEYIDDYGQIDLEELVIYRIQENFNFSEPYYGWQDFDVEAFNSRLNDELYYMFEYSK